MNRPPLRVTQFEARTLTWWKGRADKIDMSPSYQRRGRLWSDADKAYLIDSIINGFDVPKFYIADFNYSESRLNEKKLPYAIIDGKQRLEAIFDFFRGDVVLNDDFVYLEDPSLKLGGLGYRDLQSSYQDVVEKFDNFNPSIMSVITDDDELINQLFVRLNRSKPLTGAEIRNAMAGPAPEVIRSLARHSFFAENVAFRVQRGEDLNAAAKILIFEFHDKPQETKKTSLDGFVTLAANDRDKLELSARRAADSLDEMTTVFLPHDSLLSSAGIIPVYYWFLKSVDTNKHRYVREFLVAFERARRSNRKRAELNASSPEIDRELVEYDNYNRNTNDQVSHTGRVKILQDRFDKYVPGHTRELLLYAV